MPKTATRSIDLEPIDRLEEKLKLLVSMIERMKAEQARAQEENQRLSRELRDRGLSVHGETALLIVNGIVHVETAPERGMVKITANMMGMG